MSRINDLIAKIKEASEAYYNTDSPIISDEEFDSLVEELKSLDPNNPILTTPNWGAKAPSTHLRKYPHEFTVSGIGNKVQRSHFNLSSLFNNADQRPGIISAKLDGISAVAYYKDGKLQRVLSRNDGEYGLDITDNLFYCNIPKEVSPYIKWVRGEVVATWDHASKYGYSHPRNMAAGLANSNGLVEAHNALNFIAYDMSNGSLLGKFNDLKHQGFDVVKFEYFTTLEQLTEIEKKFNYSNLEVYDNYKYPVDGAVIRFDGWEDQVVLKYPTPILETKVVEVVPQISSRGRVIPVIQVEPVNISGAEINFCSGFNYASIKDQGIGPGAIIRITRANEVIPHWVTTVKPVDKPDIPSEINGLPTKWNGVHLEVPLDKTPDAISTLIGWKTPHGVGLSRINKLIQVFEINSLDRLAWLASNHEDSIIQETIKREFGTTYSDRIIETLQNINDGYPLSYLLEATYSRNLGEEAADRLMKIYKNDPQLMLKDLEDTGGLPSEVANKMPSYVVAEGVEENISLIKEMLSAGFNITKPPAEISTEGKIRVSLTGKLSKPRGKLLEEWSDKVVEVDITKAEYLITNNPASGSSKNVMADKYGVIKITEEDFWKIIRE